MKRRYAFWPRTCVVLAIRFNFDIGQEALHDAMACTKKAKPHDSELSRFAHGSFDSLTHSLRL